jgi:hypothetical protein
MEQPQRKSRLGLILGIVGVAVVACVGLVLLLVFVVFRATQPAADAAEAFMTALKDKDYAAAYDLCTSDLQGELGSVRDMQAAVEDYEAVPVSWRFSSRSVENDQAEMSGDGTFAGGREASISVVLQLVSGTWKVAGFNFDWK